MAHVTDHSQATTHPIATLVPQPGPTHDGVMGQARPHWELANWVAAQVAEGRTHRDSNYQEKWETYFRHYLNIWKERDKTRKSERSRITAPASHQAIEDVTSEMESAILENADLFNIVDDVEDMDPTDVMTLRERLLEDAELAGIEDAICDTLLVGALFGTGIARYTVEPVAQHTTSALGISGITTRHKVGLESILPVEFVIDPYARSLKSAKYAAHEYDVPLHEVQAMQYSGDLLNNTVTGVAKTQLFEDSETIPVGSEAVRLIYWCGMVPKSLFKSAIEAQFNYIEERNAGLEVDSDGVVQLFGDNMQIGDTHEMTKAIVIVANDDTLLKVAELPQGMDTVFLAYRQERIPGQFWGRGTLEKGRSSQKALDASLRARIDGLALTTNPMLLYSRSEFPGGFRPKVYPGAVFGAATTTQGALQPINFGQIDPNAFTNVADLERMVQQSTGAFDTAAPVTVNNRNETFGGQNLQAGSYVKRGKRPLRNFEREFLIPMVRGMVYMYMAIDPERYPERDYRFKPIGIRGAMSRRIEQQQIAAMMTSIPNDSPAFWILLQNYFALSDLSNREQMQPVLEQMAQQSMQPREDPMLELRKLEIEGRIRAESARIQVEHIRAQAEVMRAINDANRADSEEAKVKSQAVLALAQAEAQELGTQLNVYKAAVDRMTAESESGNRRIEDLVQQASRISSTIGGNPQSQGQQGVPVPPGGFEGA